MKDKKKNKMNWQTFFGIIMVIFGIFTLNNIISIPLTSLTHAFVKGAGMEVGVFFILWGFREIIGGITKNDRR